MTNLYKFLHIPSYLFLFLVFSNTLSAQEPSGLLSFKSEFSKYDTLFGWNTNFRACYDVTHYDLSIDININNRSLSGISKMDFVWLGKSNVIQLDLFSRYNISEITLDGQSVSYERDSNFVFIKVPTNLKENVEHTLQTSYSGKPIEAKHAPWDGGFVWKKDKSGKDWIGVACEGLGASSWWPSKDLWADEPDRGVDLHFTVPEGLTCVSNGKLLSRLKNSIGNQWNWSVKNPINLYDVTVNIADYAHIDTFYVSKVDRDTLDINFWVLRENLEKAKKQFVQVYPMLDCFEEKFGKYPFYEDGYQLVETPYLGMEHQSCIAYGNEYMPGYLGNTKMTGGYNFDYIIIHESGHEWFGNSITAADNSDMWIHEAFTTYSESIYVECLYGKDAAIKYINSNKGRVGNEKPIVGPYGVGKEGSGDMYLKGSLFLNTLRYQVNNDKEWFNYLRDINKEFYHKTTSYDDILDFTNRYFSKNFDMLFYQYLKIFDVPNLVVSYQGITSHTHIYQVFFDNTIKNLAIDVAGLIDNKEKTFTLGNIPIYISIPENSELSIDLDKTYITLEEKQVKF